MKRILVAEDDLATRLRLKSFLEAWGYEPILTPDGAQAWEKIKEERIQFVISDWIMPEMDGPELIRKIRAESLDHYVYFILLTGQNDPDHLVEGMEAGADDYLAKPFDHEELRVRIRAGERLLNLENRLMRTNRELERFTSVASHDLREPLRTISSFLMLLEKNYKGKLDDQADEYIRLTTDGAKRMSDLIANLLAYARLDSSDETREEVDTAALCHEKIAGLQAAIEESGGRVTCGPLPTVHANPTQLGQLFQNLIGNGLKYRGDLPPEVRVEAEARGDDWLFTVTDNGIGIPPDQRQSIFEPFHRLHERSSKYSGSGVGLAICKKVVEQHGGELWVTPNPIGGSIFSFTLPAQKSQA